MMMIKNMYPLVMPLIFSLYTACSHQSSYPTSENALPAGVDMVIQPKDKIEKKPSAFVDKTVMVRGEIVELPATNAFRLQYDNGVLGMGEDSVLVLEPTAKETPLTKGGNVEVIGKVRLFNIAQAERELNMPLNRDTFKKYEDKPVIIAQSVLKR